MPRKSELLSEEVQAVNSPVRRSTRLSQSREATPAEPAAATIKSRRWSASDQETTQNKSLRGAKDIEPKPDTKRPTRKSSLSEDSSETKVTPRATRRRSASVDEGLMTENAPLTRSRRQSLEPIEADIEAKRVTRRRRSSVEKQDEPEIVHTPIKTTAAKPKRRTSVTLDPIEEQTESRKSSSPPLDMKELSIILETSLKEEMNKSGTSPSEKLKRRSSKSPLLNEETGKLNILSPRRSSRRSASRSPVLSEHLTPKIRRSLLGSSDNSESTLNDKENDDKHITDKVDKVKEDEENRDPVELEEKQLGEVKDRDDKIDKNSVNELEPQETQLNDKTVADEENVVMNDTSIQSLEEEKENVLAKSNQGDSVDSASPMDKILLPKENSLQEAQIHNARVSLGRISNVFRPKDVDFSFAEPMDVDVSTLNDTRKTNIDMSRIRDSSIDESVDEDFKLTLDETEKDDVLAGSKTEIDEAGQTEEPKGETQDEATQKGVEQNKLLNGIDTDGATCQSDHNSKIEKEEEDVTEQKKPAHDIDVSVTVNSDSVDQVQAVKVDVSHTTTETNESGPEKGVAEWESSAQLHQKEDDITDQKQPAKDINVSVTVNSDSVDQVQAVKVDASHTTTEANEDGKDKDVEESETSAKLHQGQSGTIDANYEASIDEKDIEGCKELETTAQLRQSQSDIDQNQVMEVDASHSGREANRGGPEENVEEITNVHLHQSQSDTVDANQESKAEGANEGDLEKDVEQSETSSQLHQSQSETLDVNHESCIGEKDVEGCKETTAQLHQSQSVEGKDVDIDNYHEKTTVLDDTNNGVLSEHSQMDQTFQIPTEDSNVRDKQIPPEEADLESTRVEHYQTETDTSQAEPHMGITNGGCSEEDNVNESYTKSEQHNRSQNEDSVILVAQNGAVPADLETCADEDTNLENHNSSDQIFDTRIDVAKDDSCKQNIASAEVENGPKAASNNSSLSENESEWTTMSSKSNESNENEVVEVNSSPEKADTPEDRSSKKTRKLLRTVERNSTRKLNLDDSIVVVEQPERKPSITTKINKYLDSKIADMLQSNSSANDDSVFLDDEDESTEEMANKRSVEQDTNVESEEEESDEENEFLDTMAEEGEEDTPSEDSNAITDEGESIGSRDSEDPEDEDSSNASGDSFIDDNVDVDLLPGYEFDLEDVDEDKGTKRKSRIINIDNEDRDVIVMPKKERSQTNKDKKRKSRIINVDNEDTDVIIVPKKEQSRTSRKASSPPTEDNILPDYETSPESVGKNKGDKRSQSIDVDNEDEDAIIPKKGRRRRRLTPHDSSSQEDKSDAEDDAVRGEETYENTDSTAYSQSEASARRSSITILENVNVKDIKDPSMSERIHSLMESFTTHIKEGDIAMNLSLEYTNDKNVEKKAKKRKSDSSETDEAGAKKTKINAQDDNVEATSKKSKKKLKRDSAEDLKTKTSSLMNQLITDVKNRPKRSIKPSLNMESSWAVEKVKAAKPSVSMIGKKEIEEYQAKKVHPKDLRQKLLYNSGRINRIDTKTLLKKRGGI
nr:unnamed protein product [Callosobruchus analis]